MTYIKETPPIHKKGRGRHPLMKGKIGMKNPLHTDS